LEWISDPQAWIALVTLTALEIVLGIDNIIFISILAGRLPHSEQAKARILGLTLAMFTRIALLFSLTIIMRLTAPLVAVLGNEISGRDIILIVGGLFLIAKSTHEIHEKLARVKEKRLERWRLRLPASSFKSCCSTLSSPSIQVLRLSVYAIRNKTDFF